MRVAIAPLAETTIEIDLDNESIEIVTIYTRLPRSLEEVRAVYPSARGITDPRASLVERGLWQLILAGGLAAPALSKIIDAPSLRPLEGLQWRIAASAFSTLRRLYREKGDAREAAEKLIEDAFRALSDYIRIERMIERVECPDTPEPPVAMGDDRLGVYIAASRRVSRDELLEDHVLIVRSGLVERRVRPLEYSAPLRPSRLEYALLVRDVGVETGPYARLTGFAPAEIAACDASLSIDEKGSSITIRVDGGSLEVVMPQTVFARRMLAAYVDALVAGVLACRAPREAVGELRVYEVVDGPLISWGRVVTTPSLYNVYSTSIAAPEPPLARLLRTVLCLDVETAGWLSLALSALYTSCCRVVLRVHSGGKTFVQRRDAPRVTA